MIIIIVNILLISIYHKSKITTDEILLKNDFFILSFCIKTNYLVNLITKIVLIFFSTLKVKLSRYVLVYQHFKNLNYLSTKHKEWLSRNRPCSGGRAKCTQTCPCVCVRVWAADTKVQHRHSLFPKAEEWRPLCWCCCCCCHFAQVRRL